MTLRAVASRTAVGVLVALVCTGLLAGCSSDNVSCSLDACTVALDRGVEAKASVLGVGVRLVEVTQDQVVIDVNGTQARLSTGGAEAQVAGLAMKVQKVTDSEVVLDVSRG